MKKQNGKCDSNFQHQSSAKRKVLVDFLTNKSNNIKWLRYASDKVLKMQRFGLSKCLEAEDYVSEAKVIILEFATVTNAFTEYPRFSITRNGKTISMSRDQLYNYFFLLIKWNLSYALRKDQKTIPLPHWDEDDDGDISSEDEVLLFKKDPQNEFIIPFNNPFEEIEKSKLEGLIDNCIDSLEVKDPLIRKIFEERLEGVPNRIIAGKYDIPVRKVESIRKIIRRQLHLHI